MVITTSEIVQYLRLKEIVRTYLHKWNSFKRRYTNGRKKEPVFEILPKNHFEERGWKLVMLSFRRICLDSYRHLP